MKREQEKIKAAIEMYKAGALNSLQRRLAFATGVDWADQHPREGLWDAEKVINYIYEHAHVRTFGDIVMDDMSVTEFIETMKKAMED